MQGSPRRPYVVQIPGVPTQNAPDTHGVVTAPASPVHPSPTMALGTHVLLPAMVLQKVVSSHGAVPHGSMVVSGARHSDVIFVPSTKVKQMSGGRQIPMAS